MSTIPHILRAELDLELRSLSPEGLIFSRESSTWNALFSVPLVLLHILYCISKSLAPISQVPFLGSIKKIMAKH